MVSGIITYNILNRFSFKIIWGITGALCDYSVCFCGASKNIFLKFLQKYKVVIYLPIKRIYRIEINVISQTTV